MFLNIQYFFWVVRFPQKQFLFSKNYYKFCLWENAFKSIVFFLGFIDFYFFLPIACM